MCCYMLFNNIWILLQHCLEYFIVFSILSFEKESNSPLLFQIFLIKCFYSDENPRVGGVAGFERFSIDRGVSCGQI